jgi:hypothetical protein
MSWVSVTRLRIRKLRFFPGFAWNAVRSTLQARQADGNLRTLTIHERGLVFWTITVWKDPEAMRAFRNSGSHKKVMPKLSEWCDEATYVHWEQDGDSPPDLQTAYARLVSDGVVSRVRHPSSSHAARAFPTPKV